MLPCGSAGSTVRDSLCGETLLPELSDWKYPGTPGRGPSAPGKAPKRLSKEWFCITTTTTRLIGDLVGASGTELTTKSPRQPTTRMAAESRNRRWRRMYGSSYYSGLEVAESQGVAIGKGTVNVCCYQKKQGGGEPLPARAESSPRIRT